MTHPTSNGFHSSQQVNLRVLRGTQPGLLDPSQLSRLLRYPDSKLSFASFDPKTALAEEHDISRPTNSGGLTPPKRVVIETTPKGASFWRFVPRARLEEGAQDEGVWPRVIDICGEKVHCYQEQWEIYKLDPKYHCVVYTWPKCPTVTWVELPCQDLEAADPHSGKRSRWSSPESVIPKKARSRPPDNLDESDSDSDEVEVEEIVIGDLWQRPRHGRNQTGRDKIKKARLERWAKHRVVYEKREQYTTVPADGSFSMQVDSEGVFPSEYTPWPTGENPKRKGDLCPVSDEDSDGMSCDRAPREYKRSRTSPPRTYKRASRSPDKRRLERLRKHAELNQRHQEKEPTLEEEDEMAAGTSKTYSREEDVKEETPLEAERTHEAEIAESIRKLRELEKDRPMWEAQRKHREARERAEEQEQLAKAERRRKEEEERIREQWEAAEREQQRAAEEAEKIARIRRQQEQRQRRQRERWESGPWTTHRALERYRVLCEEFDAARFTSGDEITFDDIPWPVLHSPSRLRVEDVDWTAVETFFATVKSHMRLQDYKDFVEKSHRRFHPDRWRARRIWGAVMDEVERGYLEVAANTVAQAITPIWRGMKEMTAI